MIEIMPIANGLTANTAVKTPSNQSMLHKLNIPCAIPRIIGKPASPGRGKGRARIVRSPDELSRFVRGDILVTNAASPAFTPLLLVAAGLVTEAGGGATHSSLLARELGVPAVVDAGNATQVIRDGQMVEVDGTRGVVTLLE